MNETPVIRTLKRAAFSLGGVTYLANKLDVSVEDVERWIAGVPPPPHTTIYIAALGIVAGQ
jgi:hypothetical protein